MEHLNFFRVDKTFYNALSRGICLILLYKTKKVSLVITTVPSNIHESCRFVVILQVSKILKLPSPTVNRAWLSKFVKTQLFIHPVIILEIITGAALLHYTVPLLLPSFQYDIAICTGQFSQIIIWISPILYKMYIGLVKQIWTQGVFQLILSTRPDLVIILKYTPRNKKRQKRNYEECNKSYR